MRILLVAGLNDLIKGGSRESFMQDIKKFKATVDWQNRHHIGEANQFAVAPLPMPPKLVWYCDNGLIPAEHPGRMMIFLSSMLRMDSPTYPT